MLYRTARMTLALAAVVALAPIAGPPSRADDAPEIVTVTSPLVPWIGTRDRALPGSIETMRQAPATLDSFSAFVTALAGGDTKTALALQADLAYQLTRASFQGKDYLVAMDNSGAGLGPTVVLNPAATRELILEAPHATFELGSGEQATLLMARLGARAALIAGAHRCASKTASTCDGETAVCGTLAAYLDSDAAHADSSRFQAAHVALADSFPEAVVISLHGKRPDTTGARPEIIMSSGIDAPDPDHATAATQLRLALADFFQRPGAIINCNWPADDQFQHRPLCGYTNIQGRFVNKDTDVCHDSTKTGTGLFIHLEQNWPMLIPFHNDWPTIDTYAYYDALAEALTKVERIKPVAGK